MRTLIWILCLVPLLASAQDWTWTETQFERVENPEDRKLILTGKYFDADSVEIYVFHDGDTITHSSTFGTFTITLSEFDSYEILFIDAEGRKKRISVHELAERLVEFYPPMEIDFDRVGNFVLIKPDAKLPDFAELHVGVSRTIGKPKKP